MRKNVNKLSNEEVRRLRNKLKLAITEFKYDDLANFHGAPTDICEGVDTCCPHGDSTFLPWHRLYMVNMEEMLDEALPYWDWTEDTHIPQLWENIIVPFKKGAESTVDAGGERGNVSGTGLGQGDCPPGQCCRKSILV